MKTIKSKNQNRTVFGLPALIGGAGKVLVLATLMLGAAVYADDDEGEGRSLMGKIPLKVQNECAACHMVYAPALLPRSSWQRMFSSLDKHYGTDASLDAATLAEVSKWFTDNAGTYKKVARSQTTPPEDRISKSAWFIKKHDEVPASAWKHASVKSAANCTACHGEAAAKGVFNEDTVRIPK